MTTTDTSPLFVPGSAGSTGSYLRRIWALRHFVSASAWGKLSARNQGMVLGSVWLILEPLLFVGVYYIIFKVLLDASRGVENFLLFLTVGRLVFASHQSAVLGAAQSLADNPALVRESSMPKALLPIGSAVGTFFQWGIDVVVMLIVALITAQLPMLSWLLLLPISLGLLATNIGLGLLLAPAVAAFQDLKRALPIYFRLTFFTSSVMFPMESYVEDLEHADVFWVLLMMNPIYGYVKAAQWAVFGYDIGHPGWAAFSAALWSVVLLPAGFWWFVRKERSVGAFRYRTGG